MPGVNTDTSTVLKLNMGCLELRWYSYTWWGDTFTIKGRRTLLDLPGNDTQHTLESCPHSITSSDLKRACTRVHSRASDRSRCLVSKHLFLGGGVILRMTICTGKCQVLRAHTTRNNARAWPRAVRWSAVLQVASSINATIAYGPSVAASAVCDRKRSADVWRHFPK